MKVRVSAIVVVYNKKISESITCNNILKIKSSFFRIIIVDNSTKKNNNEQYCEECGIQYLTMHRNIGLSKAYNWAIKQNMDTDVFVLLDDDTEITEDYFHYLENAITKHPEVDIFAPIIRGQDGVIYSPNKSNFLRNHLICNKNYLIPQSEFNAIASCLAIRKRVFEDYEFNEKLFIDQIDQNFFDDQRSLNKKFMKLDVEIQQNFYQRSSILSAEAGWCRLQLRILDIFRYARLKNSLFFVILALIKCCGLGVQIGRKSHSINVTFNAVVLSCCLFFKPQ